MMRSNVCVQMTEEQLRDYFAGQALAGLATKPVWDEVAGSTAVGTYDADGIADIAYTYADAMLERRKHKGAL